MSFLRWLKRVFTKVNVQPTQNTLCLNVYDSTLISEKICYTRTIANESVYFKQSSVYKTSSIACIMNMYNGG